MEILFELLGPILSVAVGLVVGSVALVAMIGVRRAMGRTARATDVIAPDGAVWSVRVVFGLGAKVSTRFAGMSREARRQRRALTNSDTAVGRDEIWHPKRLLDACDEAAGLIAPVLVVAAVLIGLLFVIELLITLPIGIVFLLVSAARGRWQVEVVSPHGLRSIHDEPSLAEARSTARRTTELIEAGTDPFLGVR